MFKDENRHYSLRKLSVGLASVLIGISFASTTGNNVKADMVNGSNSAQTVVKGNDVAVKIDAKSAPEGQSQTLEAVKKDSDAITQDSKQDTVNAKVKQQNTAAQGSDAASDKALKANNSSVVQEDNNTKGDSLTDKSNALKAKAETTKKAVAAAFHPDSSETTLNLKSAKFIDPKTLHENKTEAIVNADSARGIDPVKFASNGGFDPKIWGTMDTSKWQLDNNGNITGYTGDMSYIIIPNSADFAKVGKSYSQIGISSDEMKKLGGENHFKANTLAISLTDNRKVKATNADWSNVFYESRLKQANLEGLDTGNVTNMYAMFNGAKSLTSLDVSNWKTGNVTDMGWMFNDASSLTSLDVSKWNTGNVTSMYNMFSGTSSLHSLDVSKWDTGNVTNMYSMFSDANSLTSLDVSHWDTSNVTDMSYMFGSASSLTTLDVSNWKTSKVSYMGSMFSDASSLTSLDVSNWNTDNVTNMWAMFEDANSLTSLDVSNWNTDNVTNMGGMFSGASSLALTVNNGKFANYLVKNNFADSTINSDIKSVTTDNAKLLQLLTNDTQHDSATRTIVFTFPANYSPDLTKYHLTKANDKYRIKQSADYYTSYAQGTVLINATEDITKHHIDTTKPNKLSNIWRPSYDKLVLAHKNSDGSVSFDAIRLPKVPCYKAIVKTIANPANLTNALFAVSFMALPKPATPALNDVKLAKTVSLAAPGTTKVVKTEPKITTSITPKVIDLSNNVIATTPKTIDPSNDAVATTPKTIDLSNDAVATTPKTIDLSDDAAATTPKTIDLSNDAAATTPDMSTWQVADEPDQDTYHVSNGQYAVELPHISNAQLHVIANDSTKDSILFSYKGQNSKYVFKIKFANGHYLLTTYKVESDKLVKLIDYNFVSSSKIINVILDWLKLK